MNSTESTRQVSVVLNGKSFRYVINPDGSNHSFSDVSAGIDYLDHQTESQCASIMVGGAVLGATSASRNRDLLTLRFGDSEIRAVLKVIERHGYIEVEVFSIEGAAVDSLEFLSIPLTLNGKPGEPFAACSFALNTFTHVEQLPAMQAHLSAVCYDKFGVVGAKVALIGVPVGEILPLLRKIVSNAHDLPSIRSAGAWADETSFTHGSYLFNFGTLTEETVDDWIEMAGSLGFNQIDNHGGSQFFRFGDLHLDEEKWPDGWHNYKRIVARLHEAGIASILHTYGFFIDKGAIYVTPVPHPQLDAFRSFTLAEPISESAQQIQVVESTATISTIIGFFERNSATLHIGDELVTFSGVTREPPYSFTGCTRGVHGTRVAEHPAGTQARHLKELFGYFVPDCESPLFEEIARNHAEVTDYADFDGFYLDAMDGSDLLRGASEAWYWGQRFVFLIYKHMKKRVSMEMSAMWHQMWNLRSRWQAWDYPMRGYKRFVDIHLDAVRSGLLLPLQLGWWNFLHFAPPQVEPCFPDVIDYLGCKLIGHNAGLSLTGAVNRDNLVDIPLYRCLVDRLKTLETLRHDDYFSESVRAQLREPGKEFTLCQDALGAWRFKPVSYERHKVVNSDAWSSRWTAYNCFSKQPVGLRLEALMSVGAYDQPGNITIVDPAACTTTTLSSAVGVTVAIEAAENPDNPAEVCAMLVATNTGLMVQPAQADKERHQTWHGGLPTRKEGAPEQTAAWAAARYHFEPWLDLEKYQGLGVWIYGDGNGEIMNLRLESPVHLSYGAIADHYVTIDFCGWRYVELVESESERWSDYTWDDGKSYYNVYREVIHYNAIESLSIWFNNIPAGKTVTCYLGAVKALPLVPATVTNPGITVNGAEITFPITMESGDYLEVDPTAGTTHYSFKGEIKGKVKPQFETLVLLAQGNELTFSCLQAAGPTPRFIVTTISHGEPL
jgi:hypothetical protein